MKKRSRPSFLRQLEERYRGTRPRPEDSARSSHPGTPKQNLPRVYPTAIRKPGSRRKGVIDMSVSQFVALAIVFMVLAWAGSAALAYGVVQATGGGPLGEQGVAGPRGEDGVAGTQGPPGDDAAQEMIKRLAALWSVQQASQLQGGAFVEFNDSQVGACVNYVVTGQPNVDACPGFSAPR
jgi:hypothetical protein